MNEEPILWQKYILFTTDSKGNLKTELVIFVPIPTAFAGTEVEQVKRKVSSTSTNSHNG